MRGLTIRRQAVESLIGYAAHARTFGFASGP